MKIKKNLSGQSLIKNLRVQFSQLPDSRSNCKISIADAAMSAFAIFKLKLPSLLEFDKHRLCEIKSHNIKSVFSIKNIPSDTQMRTILDRVPHHEFVSIFKNLFSLLQREKVLSTFKYNIPGTGEFYINASDGTGIFSSTKVHCDCCLVREIKSTTEFIDDEDTRLMYHHQMLGSGIVHPDKKLVIPMAPESILQQDGTTKNDCESAAMKRYLFRLKEEHPKLPFIIATDALHANTPMLTLIKSLSWSYIIMLKSSSHKYLFKEFEIRITNNTTVIVEDEIGEKVIKKRKRTYRFVNNIKLNRVGCVVNALDFREVITWENKKGLQKKEVHMSWATDIEIHAGNVFELMKTGRSRWKDENEIFNTLKNQGYHLEHNFGHGKENLAANFALFANLAFLTDQIEELSCPLYQTARDVMGTKNGLWKKVQVLIEMIEFESWTDLIESIAFKIKYVKKNSS